MAGYPAGLVLDSVMNNDSEGLELRVAFDFDGVLADDAAEQVFKAEGLEAFHKSESERADVPHNAGPLHELLAKIAKLQELDKARAAAGADRGRRIKIAIITSRNAPAHKRVVTSLRAWGITIDQTFFLGGMDKAPILKTFRPHIFFDDQKLHLDAAAAVVPCVHVPVVRRSPRMQPPVR